MSKDQPIEEMLRARGFDTPESMKAARAAMEAVGLTNPRKTNICTDKVQRVDPGCGEYARASCQGRVIVRVSP